MSTPSWIKMTDRAPTEADLPVLLWNARVPKMKYTATADALRCQLGLTCFTAWRPAPEPPQMEPTQRQKDHAEGLVWYRSTTNVGWLEAWHAALAYERGEVAKMLPKEPAASYKDWIAWKDANERAIEAIRARCGGGGK